MLTSPVGWYRSVFSLALLVAASAGCQGSIGGRNNVPTGQAGGSVTGAAGVTGSGTAGSTSTGVAGGGGGGGTIDQVAIDCMASNGVLNAGLTPARRLTRDQFNNTVRDLLGATGTPGDALAPDEKIGPFHSNAIAPVDVTLVQQHQEVAATLATSARSRMTQISPCDLASDTGTSTTCATRARTASC